MVMFDGCQAIPFVSSVSIYTSIGLIYVRQRFLLSNDIFSSKDLAGDLRETILQDSSEFVDEGPLMAEIAARLCFELAYGTPSPWRYIGYVTLFDVYNTAHGCRSLQDLAYSGPLIDELATITFTK